MGTHHAEWCSKGASYQKLRRRFGDHPRTLRRIKRVLRARERKVDPLDLVEEPIGMEIHDWRLSARPWDLSFTTKSTPITLNECATGVSLTLVKQAVRLQQLLEVDLPDNALPTPTSYDPMVVEAFA